MQRKLEHETFPFVECEIIEAHSHPKNLGCCQQCRLHLHHTNCSASLYSLVRQLHIRRHASDVHVEPLLNLLVGPSVNYLIILWSSRVWPSTFFNFMWWKLHWPNYSIFCGGGGKGNVCGGWERIKKENLKMAASCNNPLLVKIKFLVKIK